MKVPQEITIGTKEYVEIMTKINLYIATYGCKWVHNYVNNIPLRYRKIKGRNAGAYIVSKVCNEYKVTEYDLFQDSGRKELTEARQVLCALVSRHLKYNQTEISSYFGKTRFFATRAIQSVNQRVAENHPFDKKMIARFKKLDGLISSYLAFNPKSQKS